MQTINLSPWRSVSPSFCPRRPPPSPGSPGPPDPKPQHRLIKAGPRPPSRWSSHGTASLGDGLLEYVPQADYFGRDSLVLENPDGLGRRTVELRIYPRFLLLAGHFDGDLQAVGLFDAETRSLRLCASPSRAPSRAACRRLEVTAGGPLAVIPLAWPSRAGTRWRFSIPCDQHAAGL